MALDPKRLDIRIERVGNGWLIEPTQDYAPSGMPALGQMGQFKQILAPGETFVATSPTQLVTILFAWASVQEKEANPPSPAPAVKKRGNDEEDEEEEEEGER